MSARQEPTRPVAIELLEDAYEVAAECASRPGVHIHQARRRSDGSGVLVMTYATPGGDEGNALSHLASDANLLQRLQHPGVAQVVDGRWLGNAAFAVIIPRVNWPTLRELMAQEARMPVSRVAMILREVHEVMSWARSQGVVHRGVHPDTTWVDPDTDRVLVSLAATPIPFSGVPDACTDGRSLGELAWTMLAGKAPHGRAPGEALSVLRPDLPNRVVAVTETMLECDTGGTPPDVAQFVSLVAMADVLREGEVEAARMLAEVQHAMRQEREQWEGEQRECEHRNATLAEEFAAERAEFERLATEEREALAAERAELQRQRAELERQAAQLGEDRQVLEQHRAMMGSDATVLPDDAEWGSVDRPDDRQGARLGPEARGAGGPQSDQGGAPAGPALPIVAAPVDSRPRPVDDRHAVGPAAMDDAAADNAAADNAAVDNPSADDTGADDSHEDATAAHAVGGSDAEAQGRPVRRRRGGRGKGRHGRNSAAATAGLLVAGPVAASGSSAVVDAPALTRDAANGAGSAPRIPPRIPAGGLPGDAVPTDVAVTRRSGGRRWAIAAGVVATAAIAVAALMTSDRGPGPNDDGPGSPPAIQHAPAVVMPPVSGGMSLDSAAGTLDPATLPGGDAGVGGVPAGDVSTVPVPRDGGTASAPSGGRAAGAPGAAPATSSPATSAPAVPPTTAPTPAPATGVPPSTSTPPMGAGALRDSLARALARLGRPDSVRPDTSSRPRR
jgi:hypothetical protein